LNGTGRSLGIPVSQTGPAIIALQPVHTVHIWNVPYRRNLFFTGREDILAQLRTALTTDTAPVALSQPQAISGLGGIGKTQTAVEYAYRFRDFYENAFWVHAESADLLISDFLTLASLLNLPERNEQDQQVVVNWRLYQEYLSHALFCIDILQNKDYVSRAIARLFLKVGIYFTVREQYLDAQRMLLQALELQKRLLPADIPMLADTMSALAGAYYEQGMYTQAEMLYKDALAEREQFFGAEHPQVASIFNSLGLVYWQMTRYEEAEEMFKRSLRINQQQGVSQTDLADNLNNLALIYLYQGKYAEAAPLFEQAAMLWHRHEGPLHPSTLICQGNIAVTYLRLAKYAQAERIFTDLLAHYAQMERDAYPRHFDAGNALYNPRAEHPDYVTALDRRAATRTPTPTIPEAERRTARRAYAYVTGPKNLPV
jgi:tetratricopeptide (TPR) repeat protein